MWFSAARSTRLPAHTHDVLEVNLVMAGSLEYAVGGETILVRSGECLFVPRGVGHELVNASDELALWVFELDCELDFDRLGAVSKGDIGWARPSLAWTQEVARVARKLWLRPEGDALSRASARLRELLDSPLGHRADSANMESTHEAVLRARRICEERTNEDLAIESLAREAGLSASRLAHLFQEQVGLSPLQYRNFSRIQEFVRRWNGEAGTLLAAALAAGFGSYPQFHRVFCQVCGEPPRDHLNWLDRTEIDRGGVFGVVTARSES